MRGERCCFREMTSEAALGNQLPREIGAEGVGSVRQNGERDLCNVGDEPAGRRGSLDWTRVQTIGFENRKESNVDGRPEAARA